MTKLLTMAADVLLQHNWGPTCSKAVSLWSQAKYNEYTPEHRVKMGRYGTESGREKDARHFFSFQIASCHEAYVVVVMSYLVEGPNRQSKLAKLKNTTLWPKSPN